MQPDPNKTNQSLELSWKEGIPASVMLGVIDYYITPFGLFLGATTQQIGFLVAIPQLLASISQLFAAFTVRKAGSRLKFIVAAAGLQGILLVPMAFLAIFPFHWQVQVLILLMILFRVLGNLITTSWGSLVSDYLPPQKRGHYFGWRSQVVGIAALASVIATGIILFLMKGVHPALGFLLILLGASVFRFASVWMLSKMMDLPLHQSSDEYFSFFDFILRFRESNFVKFVIFVSAMILATFISGPYISVYILKGLHLDYLSYMGIQSASVLSSLIAYPIWGKHADLLGNARILKITGFFIAIIPFLWLTSPLLGSHLIVLLAIESFAGFMWGGFNLCVTNFIFDAVRPHKRVRCLGYFNLINGTALFTGSLLGGYLSRHLPPINGFTLLTVFLVSGIARFTAYFLFSSLFKEVREGVKKAGIGGIFLSILGIRPLEGINRNWGFFPKREEKLPAE